MISEFNVGQRTAVRNAFKLVGFEGELRVLPPLGTDEYIFVLPRGFSISQPNVLSQVLQQLLHRKIWVTEDGDQVPESVPFPLD